MHQLLLVLHRWTALVAGVVLLALSVSGAVLVFEGSLDRGLYPALFHATPGTSPLPIDSLIRAVEEQYPGVRVESAILSPVPGRAWTFAIGDGSAFVDPYTGTVNGRRTAAEARATISRRMHDFHVTLFAGKGGRAVVGAMAVVGFLLTLTGLVLWWREKRVRVQTRASWKRILFDLHHTLGLFAAPVLLLMTASGLAIHSSRIASLLRGMDRTPPPAMAELSHTMTARPSFDSLAAVARRALPGASVTLMLPGDSASAATIIMRFPEDRTPAGRSRVMVDPGNYRPLLVLSSREAGRGTRLDNLKRSLHTGDVLGRPTAVLWLLATLVLASQVVTGVSMWWNGRKRQ